MTTPYTGGCACGAVRYTIAAEPIFENHCQCRDCQQRSGTGHGSYLSFLCRSEAAITGETAEWRVTADSGRDKLYAFCPRCGTPTHLTFPAMPKLIAVPAASLDDPTRFHPAALTYAIRGEAWDPIDETLPRFERMPGG